VFTFCALVLWTYFSSVVGFAGQSLVTNANLITKVYFPRIALPCSSAISGLLDLALGLVFMVGLMIYYGVYPGWSVLLAPVFVVSLVFLSLGVSLILAALNVWYRDVKYAVPFLIQIGLFVTPVIYPMSMVP